MIRFLLDSRESFLYVDFDERERAFETPQSLYASDADAADAARRELSYTLKSLSRCR
jgi:hypothetical protein